MGRTVSPVEDDTVTDQDDLASCTDCFAVVRREDQERHFAWHDRVLRDAAAAALVVVNDTVVEPQADR